MDRRILHTALRLVMVVVGAMAVAGCWWEVSVGCTATPAPEIRSSPPTAATVGQLYRYYVDARWACFLFGTCNSIDGVQLPAGAEIDDFYDSVTWVPPESAANSDVRFVIATEPDACDDRITQSWTVHVYPAPAVASFTADPAVLGPGQSTWLTAVFQGTGRIEGLGPVASGVAVQTPALPATTEFTLTVVNEVGTEIAMRLTVQVLQPPVIQSLTAAPALVTAGAPSTLSWSASGDFSMARLDPPGVSVLGLSSLSVSPGATTTYVLTLANAAGGSASAGVEVTTVPPPVIDSFTAMPASVPLRGHVDLVPEFRDGTGDIQMHVGYDFVSLGAVTSGAPVDPGELLRTTTFLLTVRNAAGTEVTQYVRVPVTGPGTFQPALGRPIHPLRARHTATRLADGRVFLAGNWPDTELFDPSSESFASGPSLPEPLFGMAAALLPDGRVLLVGGYRTDGTRALDAHVYDPAANRLDPLGPLPVADLVAPQAVALPDGRVLIVHSSLGQGSETFDAATGIFTAVGPLLASHGCIRAVRIPDGRVVIVEGSNDSPSEIFAPATGEFSQTGTLGLDRCYFSGAALPDGRVLVTGGSSTFLPAEVLDPVAGAFATVGSQAYPASSGATATPLDDGRVLVTAGWVYFAGQPGGGNSPWAELFDPAGGSFALTGGLAGARHDHTATLLEDGRVLVVGGCAEPPCDAELYTPP